MKTRNPRLGALYALTGAFLFGLNASTSKVIISSGITAEQVVLYRSAATALLAGVVLAFTFRAGFKVRARELPLLVTFGIVGVGLMQWAYSQAVAGLQVGIALLIEYTAIIWVPLVSLVLFRDKVQPRIWIAVLLVLGGLAVVADTFGGSVKLSPTGLMFAGLAAAFLTFYFIAGKRVQKSRDTMSALFYSMLISTFFWLVASPWWQNPVDLTAGINLAGNLAGLTIPTWMLLIWLGVFGSFVPMWLSYRALHHLNPTGVGIASTAETVFAFGFGLLWLGESFSAIQLVGGLLVIGGIVLAQTKKS
jgi:drug/metabolite transporter (DMT)-like permease